MLLKPRRAAFTALCMLSALWLPPMASGDNAVQQSIFDKWTQREKSISSARVEWTTKLHREPGTMINRDGKGEGPHGEVYPPSHLNSSVTESFSFVGDKWRFERRGMDWHNRLEAVAERRFIACFDGAAFWKYEGVDSSDVNKAHDLGFIRSEFKKDREAPAYPSVMPIMCYVRPFAKDLGCFAPADWTADEILTPGTVNDLACHVITFRRRTNSAQTRRCYVSLDRDCTVQRVLIGDYIHVTIDYIQDAQSTWVPSGWEVSVLTEDKTGIDKNERISVTSWQLNPRLDETNFSPSFPVGTEISDSRHSQTVPRMTIIQAGGKERVITEDERKRRAPYQELMRTESGKARGSSELGNWDSAGLLWIAIPSGLLVCVAACIVWWRTVGLRTKD